MMAMGQQKGIRRLACLAKFGKVAYDTQVEFGQRVDVEHGTENNEKSALRLTLSQGSIARQRGLSMWHLAKNNASWRLLMAKPLKSSHNLAKN